MAKNTKTAKSLPSALTVASSAQSNSQTPSAAAPSAQAGSVKAAARTRKSSTPPAAVLSPPKAAAGKQAQSLRAARTVEVAFAFLEPHAKGVSLCGAFNAWSPDATPLNRQHDGLWETRLALPPGRYEYKFVVDGQWLPDPNAHENVVNGHGTLNSVVEVRA